MISCKTSNHKPFASHNELKEKQRSIDSLAERKILQTYFYAKLKHSDTLFETTYSWPEHDSVLKTYIIYKDSPGKIIYISERSYHYEAGINTRENYYFDNDGKTFVYEHYEDVEGAAFIKLCYYNNQFDLVALEDSTFNQGTNVFSSEPLPLTTKLDFTVSPSCSAYFKTKNVKIK
jgi:hypothetical protein